MFSKENAEVSALIYLFEKFSKAVLFTGLTFILKKSCSVFRDILDLVFGMYSPSSYLTDLAFLAWVSWLQHKTNLLMISRFNSTLMTERGCLRAFVFYFSVNFSSCFGIESI